MINRVVLVGRLTKSPELKQTQSNIPVARFTLAVNRPFQNAQGEREADFISVVVWRKPAENCAKYLEKGSLVGLDGRIQTGSFEGTDGKRVYTTEVVADSVQFLDRKPDGNTEQRNGVYTNGGSPTENQNILNNLSVSDDDLPF